MTKLIEFFRVRSTDDSHAMDRISVAAGELGSEVSLRDAGDAAGRSRREMFPEPILRVKRLFNCHCEMVPAVAIYNK
jgi:hypothetical protein